VECGGSIILENVSFVIIDEYGIEIISIIIIIIY